MTLINVKTETKFLVSQACAKCLQLYMLINKCIKLTINLTRIQCLDAYGVSDSDLKIRFLLINSLPCKKIYIHFAQSKFIQVGKDIYRMALINGPTFLGLTTKSLSLL